MACNRSGFIKLARFVHWESETDEKENIETNLLEVKLQVALTMFSTKKERKMYQLIKGRKGSNFEPRFCSSR